MQSIPVRVSAKHKKMLKAIHEDAKKHHDELTARPTQEGILNSLIAKEFKRRGLEDES
jgi:hypothetical protein